MHDLTDIHATRFSLFLSPNRDRVYTPTVSDYWQVELVWDGFRVIQLMTDAMHSGRELYGKVVGRVQPDNEFAGYVVDIQTPIRVASEIYDLTDSLNRIEPQLQELEQDLERCRKRANFGSDTGFEEAARAIYPVAHDAISHCRLALHSYIWMIWIVECTVQCTQLVNTLATRHGKYGNLNSFPFAAHPLLLVATIGSTSLIEEVGCAFINKLTSGSMDPDNTNSSTVLQELESTNVFQDEDLDFDLIRDYIHSTRVDFAHYIVRRGDSVRFEDLEEFIKAVYHSLRLVSLLLDELASNIANRAVSIGLP